MGSSFFIREIYTDYYENDNNFIKEVNYENILSTCP